MRLKIAGVTLLVLIAVTAFGTSAFTSASVDRAASVNVTTDAEGLIALGDGTSGDVVSTTNGELDIDFAQGTAAGVNVDSTYRLGKKSSPNTDHAFTITNKDASAHTLTLKYESVTSDSASGTDNLKFHVYSYDAGTSTSTREATLTEGNSTWPSFSASSGTTYYVVVVVDTHGMTTTDDLSGTLNVTA